MGSEPPLGATTTAANGLAGTELRPYPPVAEEGPSAGEDAAPELLDWGSIDDEDGAFGQLSEAGMTQDLDLCPHSTEPSQEGGMGTAAASTIDGEGRLQDTVLPESVEQKMAVRQATAEGLLGSHAERTAVFNEPAPAASKLGVPVPDRPEQSTTHCASPKLPEASESSAQQDLSGEPGDGRRAKSIAVPAAAEARPPRGHDAAVLPAAAEGIDGQQAAVRGTQPAGVPDGEEDINASATPTAEGSTRTCNGPKAGLSGSSAIICAALSCLLDFYDVRHLIKVEMRPNLILNAEKELGIVAGLQDRVAQVYGGLVYMDFSQEHMDKLGHGIYMPLDANLLPPLYLIYAENPSDSGKVHNTVRQRWLDGDEFIISRMKEVAQLAFDGHKALLQKDYTELARLMNKNFDLRREMFGDDVLGSVNIMMVEVARSVGASSKFTGSGGAVVALCPDGDSQVEHLRKACEAAGFVVQQVKVAPSMLTDAELSSLLAS